MSFPTASSTSSSATTTAIPRDIGGRLRHFRVIAGITREETGTFMGRSAGAVRDWELGQRFPSAVQVAKLARFYGVDLSELTGSSMKASAVPEGASACRTR